MLFSSNGMSVRFNEQRVRPMGRSASGVKGMTLNPGDTVVGVVVVDASTESILSVTENGFGKRTFSRRLPGQKPGWQGGLHDQDKRTERQGNRSTPGYRR